MIMIMSQPNSFEVVLLCLDVLVVMLLVLLKIIFWVVMGACHAKNILSTFDIFMCSFPFGTQRDLIVLEVNQSGKNTGQPTWQIINGMS